MQNNKFSEKFSAPTDKNDAKRKADKLINNLSKEEKTELQGILDDRNRINEILSSPAARKIMEKLNGEKNGH